MAKTRPVTNPEWLRLTRRAVALCDKYGVLMDEVCGRSKIPQIVKARVAVAVMLRASGLSYPMIGRFVKKDHSTILNEVRRARAAGLARPDGVHLGSDRTIGPREVMQGAAPDDATEIPEKPSVPRCSCELPA